MIQYIEQKRKYTIGRFAGQEFAIIDAYIGGNHIGKIEENISIYNGQQEYRVYQVGCDGRDPHIATCSTVIEAKAALRKRLGEWQNSGKTGPKNVTALPSADNSDFYPTPSNLAGKMFGKVDWMKVQSVLEPSAGKGDIVEALRKFADAHSYRGRSRGVYVHGEVKENIDVIENDYNLRLILRGKEERLIHDDFLNFHTNKRYDLIIMNPPFSNGDEHLIKAIQMQQNGGQIVCLLNAETIRNPYTNRRKLLKELLAKYEASIEFIQDAFKKAERRTDVEIALVYLNIKSQRKPSQIWEKLQEAEEQETDMGGEFRAIIGGDYIEQILKLYEMEAKAGISFIEEYAAISPYIQSDFDGKDSKPIISLKIKDHEISNVGNHTVESYLKQLRLKYWYGFLNREEVKEKMTSQMQEDYYSTMVKMKNYDFNRHNIMQVLFDIQGQLQEGIEESIIKLFDKLSAEHAWYSECSGNIHYYNGWKTNKAHKIGSKVIIPVNGICAEKWYHNYGEIKEYEVYRIISDMERAMNFLDSGKTTSRVGVEGAIRRANDMGKKTASFTYFEATFYKKGTCHIKFYPEAQHIVDRLNIFAARKRCWLPPDYGKTNYKDMAEEEKAVIDSFQGEKEYEKVCKNPAEYILDATAMALLPEMAG